MFKQKNTGRSAFLIAALGFILLFSESAWSQKAVSSSETLQPKHIIEDFEVEAPEGIKSNVILKNMKFFNFEVGEAKYILFSEPKNCDPTGCMQIVFTILENTLKNPIIFFSNDPIWVDEKNTDMSTRRLCVSNNIVFVCNGE